MLLVVDIGNTRIKWGVFEHENLMQQGACLHADLEKSKFLADAKTCQQAVIGNVAADAIKNQVVDLLTKFGLKPTLITSAAQACGVLNGYKMPKSLGIDRWAAIVAAHHLNKQTTLVVNAGTAITIDALEVQGEQAAFVGGSIMPGLSLMQNTLQSQTANLKLPTGSLQALPTQTDDAIASGLLNAAVGAIELATQTLSLRTLSVPAILLTGGDALQLQAGLKFYGVSANIAENLVLQGLHLLSLDLLESGSA
jgi:type III pantothenate kinase